MEEWRVAGAGQGSGGFLEQLRCDGAIILSDQY